MAAYDKLMQRVADGARILTDGATGTEIERRGVPQLDNAWNGGGALSHPDILTQVHADYIRAGAEIIISNTFATALYALEDAGVDADFVAYNQRAVELAREAREMCHAPDVLVAGGLSYWTWSGRVPSLDEIRQSAEAQANIMTEAGADLLMLEMMVDHEQALIMYNAAARTGRPVWVGLSCARDSEGEMRLMHGDPIEPLLDALRELQAPLINIMHTEVEDVAACLDILDQNWSGPVGVYAHSARWVGQVTQFEGTIPPEVYARQAQIWMQRGVQLIGGCCRLGVAHIEALQPLVTAQSLGL
ncbi:homocysteine S-methyltransferase family protein [Roseovarius sp. 2305UL8-3]|uniref:homocysteine S-methyltransferase family protein n=1 Tax=Roseovarius conchicola TaxID=3121636 RepID=UPI003529289F